MSGFGSLAPSSIILIILFIALLSLIIFLLWQVIQNRGQRKYWRSQADPPTVKIIQVQPRPVSEAQELWDTLTERQKQITRLVAQGKQNAGIARELNIEPSTVNSHLKKIFKHFNVHSRTKLAAALRDVVDDSLPNL